MVAYAYPPTALLAKVLAKMEERACEIVLIAPFWPKQPWFPKLVGLLVDFPIELPQIPKMLMQPRSTIFHDNPGIYALHAWKLSRTVSEREGFRVRLRSELLSPRRLLVWKSIGGNSTSSGDGVLTGGVIPVALMRL